MGLSDAPVTAVIAVSDMDKAKQFYEGTLGPSSGEQQPDGGIRYPAGSDTSIHVYPSPDNAGSSGATRATFKVDDVEKTIEELSGKGVNFEQFDVEGIKTDERGIVDLEGTKAAFFKDPDGNLLAVGDV